ncbi:MAG: hypothetical protein ACHP7J_00175 [Terriglobales bacterium]
MPKPTTREEFLRIVASSKTVAEAALKLGVAEQSVKARLDRIRLRGGRDNPRAMAGMDDKELEAAWNDALGERDVSKTDDLFGEMCRRLEERDGKEAESKAGA